MSSTSKQRNSTESTHQLKVFQVHAVVAAVSLVIIFLVNLFTNLAADLAREWSSWWSVWALIGWGLALGVHGLVVYLAKPDGEVLASQG